MREIKFRAKANINDEWIYASNIHKVILDDTNEKLWAMHPKNEKIKHLGNGYIKYRPLVVDEETIGQYTGLKDKNGVEVYEGDILTVEKHNKIGVVKFNEEVCSFELYNEDSEESLYLIQNAFIEYHVIGNIYENSVIYSNTKTINTSEVKK